MKLVSISATGLALLFGCGQPSEPTKPSPNLKVEARPKKKTLPEVKEEIAVLVRSGFWDKPRISEIVCEEMYEPGEQDPSEVASTIDDELVKLAEEKKTWPAITDCDRLNSAFDKMSHRGILAMHNAGNTQSDGYDDFIEAYARHPNKNTIIGYCYYHGQDLERAVRGGGLFFAFGPADPKKEDTEGPTVGKMICEELERAGLHVEWDGTFGKRIRVPKFLWQKR
jgi:hypothetical protein